MASLSLPGDILNSEIEPRSPTLQADSLPADPPGKPKNTGVGSLSLLQQVFPTPESNWGLLHCRRILYQLSSRGSPRKSRSASLMHRCVYHTPRSHHRVVRRPCIYMRISGTSLVVQQLRHYAPTARGTGLIPGWGTKMARVPSLVRELRSLVPHSVAKK